MQPFVYTALPAKVIFGFGTLARVADEVRELGCRRALVLSTSHQQAEAGALAEQLGELSAGIFAEAAMHTPVAVTERALEGRSPQAVHGGWTIAARHAGVVVGLLLLTPVFTTALDTNEDRALRAGAAAVLDSSIPPLDKLGLAQDVLAIVRASDREVPDVREAFVDRPDDEEYRSLESTLVSELDRAVTAAFARPFLLAALLALAALVPIAWSRGRVSV